MQTIWVACGQALDWQPGDEPCPGCSVLCFLSGAYPVTLPWFEKQYLPAPSPKKHNWSDACGFWEKPRANGYVKVLHNYTRPSHAFELRIYYVAWGWKKSWTDTPSSGPKTPWFPSTSTDPTWGLLCRPQSGLWRLLWAQNGKIIKVDRLTTLLVSTLQSPHRPLSKMYPYSDLLLRLQSQLVTKDQLARAFRN